MPTSSTENKEVVKRWHDTLKPLSVVDIGPGEGTYARLVGHTADDPDTYWIGVEVWGPYIAQYGLTKLYDHIIVADARYLDPREFQVDLVIAGDMLEHMRKSQARALMTRICRHAGAFIVSVPVLHLYANDISVNPFEAHIDHWTAQELASFLSAQPDGELVEQVTGDVLTYALWRRK